MLLILYLAVFALAIFVPRAFLAVAFDSGGVTTGQSPYRLLWRLASVWPVRAAMMKTTLVWLRCAALGLFSQL